MDRPNFDRLVSGTLMLVAKNLQTQHPSVNWQLNWEDNLYTAYEAQRVLIRDQMDLANDVSGHRIDRHKIAAAMTRAILTVRPLVSNGNTSSGARLINETLAVLSGMLLIKYFILQRIAETHPTLHRFLKTKNICFPPTNDEPYVTHASKMLGHHPDGGNLLILANLFFLLETHHLQKIAPNSPAMPPSDEELVNY
jgi:hypothetical protein